MTTPANDPITLEIIQNSLQSTADEMFAVMKKTAIREGIRFVIKHIEAGRFRPEIDRVFPFDQTVEAYRHMLGNAQCGKIVVRAPDH
ncbi:MAG: zinc-binding dehydrogenase [Brucellaceae bacterium]|nr:zinc-binding dehydrogenase [Notoacmeibacter sp.]MCB1446759.1 zinc-binding dehydrogenase [Rhizobiaceae bacterium]MCC0026754.1 zinc-binding dehydrogenase [Brucellaceae bacterium]